MIEQYFKLPNRKVTLSTYKKEEKIPKLDEKNLEKASFHLISISVHLKSLIFHIEQLVKIKLLYDFSLIRQFKAEIHKLISYFEKVVLKEERKGYFQDKLRAIENINDYLITSDDETIFRTEKFIESILTKKR
jgi:hypothetical protein